MIDIATRRIGNTTLLALTGRMDSTSKQTLMEVITREISRPDQQIALDLADVSYISTSGLKILRQIYEETGAVRLVQPSERVSEVLQITGLNSVYQFFNSQLQAIHAISPIVNAHTHLELGWLDEFRPDVTGQAFFDWILNTVSTARKALGNRLEAVSKEAAVKSVQKLIAQGTTTVCDITTTGASLAPLIHSDLKGVVYVEVLGLTKEDGEARLKKARELIDEWRPKERKDGVKIGLSLHSPYTVLPDLWHDALDYVRDENLPLCIHAAESPAEYDFFTKGTGEIAEANIKLGMDFESPKVTPIAYLEDIGALDLRPLLVHAVHVDDEDITRIVANECSVVHCPRSNLRLRCGRMPLEKYVAANVPVYLGTDSLGSSPSLNVLDEIEVAVALHHGKVEPEKIKQMAHRPLVI